MVAVKDMIKELKEKHKDDIGSQAHLKDSLDYFIKELENDEDKRK